MAGRLSSAISSGLVHPLLLLLFGLAVSYVGNEDLARHRQKSRKDSLGNPIGIGPLPIHAFRTSYKRMVKVGNKSTQKKHQGVKRQAHDKPTTQKFQDKSYKFSEFSAPGGPSCGWGSRSPRFLGLPALQPQRCKTWRHMETHGDTWFTAQD